MESKFKNYVHKNYLQKVDELAENLSDNFAYEYGNWLMAKALNQRKFFVDKNELKQFKRFIYDRARISTMEE